MTALLEYLNRYSVNTSAYVHNHNIVSSVYPQLVEYLMIG